MDWIFNSLLACVLSGVGKLLSLFSAYSLSLFTVPMVKSVLDLFQWCGMLIYAIGVLFGIFNYMIASKDNEMVDLPGLTLNIVYGFIATVMLLPGALFAWNFSVIFEKGFNNLIDQSNAISLVQVDKINNLFQALKGIIAGVFDGFWALVIFVIILIPIFIVLIQCAKRAGLFLIQIMVGYLYIFSIPSGGSDGFIEWCRQTIAIAVTNAIQVGLLLIGINLLADLAAHSQHLTAESFLGIGVILATTSVEKIAGRFGLAVNSRQHIGGAISQANSSISFGNSVGSAIARFKG